MSSNLLQHFVVDLKPLLPYTGWWLLQFPTSLFADIRAFYSAVKQLSAMDAGLALWRLLISLLKFPVHYLLTAGSLCLNAIASLINNLFTYATERPLSESEVRYLSSIFGNNLDYAVIRLQTDGIKERLRISPQAVGNDIFMRHFWGSPMINSDGTLSHAGLSLLGHEACHVWQFQTEGAAYIGNSLITQALDLISRRFGLSLTDGYNVVAALKSGTSFEHCNVEQQAVMAETIGAACFVSGLESPQITDLNRFFDTCLSDAQYSSVLQAHQKLKGSA
jgi:hypothetical protein